VDYRLAKYIRLVNRFGDCWLQQAANEALGSPQRIAALFLKPDEDVRGYYIYGTSRESIPRSRIRLRQFPDEDQDMLPPGWRREGDARFEDSTHD